MFIYIYYTRASVGCYPYDLNATVQSYHRAGSCYDQCSNVRSYATLCMWLPRCNLLMKNNASVYPLY